MIIILFNQFFFREYKFKFIFREKKVIDLKGDQFFLSLINIHGFLFKKNLKISNIYLAYIFFILLLQRQCLPQPIAPFAILL